jgi:hypothetical protein
VSETISAASSIDPAEPGRADVHRVAPAALDDLRVAADHRNTCSCGRGCDRVDLGPQLVGGETFLEDERERQCHGSGAGDGEVVDGPVDGELADRPAREPDRPDDEAVRRQREIAHNRRIRELRQPERGREEAFDERLRRLAAGAVRHRDPLVAEAERTRSDSLDQVEGVLLALLQPRHTAARSRANRPKL